MPGAFHDSFSSTRQLTSHKLPRIMNPLPYIIYALLVVSSSVFAADTPTEKQGAHAMALKIANESNGLLGLVKFTKTNGQKSVVNGVSIYTMECTVEVVAKQNCALTGFQFGGGWNGSFSALQAQNNASSLDVFNPSGAAYGTNRQLAQGAHLTFNTNIVFDLTERGWRTGNFLAR